MNDDIRTFGTGLGARPHAQAGVHWWTRNPEQTHIGGHSEMTVKELHSPVGWRLEAY